MAIDQCRHRSFSDYIKASADQRKIQFRKVNNVRRLRDPPGEPGLDSVTIGRRDIDRLWRHQRPYVGIDNAVAHDT